MRILQSSEVPKRPTNRSEGYAKYEALIEVAKMLEPGQAVEVQPDDELISQEREPGEDIKDFLDRMRTNLAGTVRRHVANPMRAKGLRPNFNTYCCDGAILVRRGKDGIPVLVQSEDPEAIEAARED